METSQKKLRILCFHGHYNNIDVIKCQIAYYQYIFKDYIDFEYIQGPHEVKDLVYDKTIQKKFKGPFYTWILNTKDANTTSAAEEFEKSYGYSLKFLDDNGPYDGVLAFSQGG